MIVLMLAALLVVPGLLALMMLMSWLERTFAEQEVADEIAELLEAEADPDAVDDAIARIASPLFPMSAAPPRA